MISRKTIWLVGTMLLAVILSSCNMGVSAPATGEASGDDASAIQTQAFSIVITQVALEQAQTAQAIPPTSLPTNTPPPTATLGAIPTVSLSGTNTPFAFNTQQPGLTPIAGASAVPTVPGVYSTITTQFGCNNGVYLSESPPYDGATILAGKEITKSWEILNNGTCTWDEGYSFIFMPNYSTSPDGASLGYYGKDEMIGKFATFTKPGETRTFTIQFKVPSKLGEYTWAFKLKDDAGNLFGSMVRVNFISVEK